MNLTIERIMIYKLHEQEKRYFIPLESMRGERAEIKGFELRSIVVSHLKWACVATNRKDRLSINVCVPKCV